MTDDPWIVIPDWDRFQHYKDRNPPWLKIYTELLHDDEWLTLAPRTRSLLCGIWLLYASSRCAIRAHTGRLGRALNQQVLRSDIERLEQAGFIELSASKPLAGRYQPASKPLASRAPAHSQEAETEEESAPLERLSSSNGTKPRSTRPAAQQATPPAPGTNLIQDAHVADQALEPYRLAYRWLRDGDNHRRTDWRHFVETEYGVTDDIDLAALEQEHDRLQNQ